MDSTRTPKSPPLAWHAHMQKGQPAPKPVTPTVKDRPLDDDIVPSLSPDWEAPTFLIEEMAASESEASDTEVGTSSVRKAGGCQSGGR